MGLKMIDVCRVTGFTIRCSKSIEFCKSCGQQETSLIQEPLSCTQTEKDGI